MSVVEEDAFAFVLYFLDLILCILLGLPAMRDGPQIVQVRDTSVNLKFAKLNVNETDGSTPVTSYLIQYRNASQGWVDGPSVLHRGEDQLIQVTVLDLESGSGYVFRVVPKALYDEKEYSGGPSLTTYLVTPGQSSSAAYSSPQCSQGSAAMHGAISIPGYTV